MVNLKSFTNALTVFCILVFVQFFIPESMPKFSSLMKYVTIISTIIILMMYNKILGKIPSLNLDNDPDDNGDENKSPMELKQTTSKSLYERLTTLIIETASSINSNSRSAIYIIDPVKTNFTLQEGKVSEFVDTIPLTNDLVTKHISKKKKFYQKDYPREWSEIFFG